MSNSKSSNKSIYSSEARNFIIDVGAGSDVEFDAMVLYWLSWYVLSSDPDYSLNFYMFPLLIRLTKGERLALMPIYLHSLFIDWINVSAT